jgi:hypothetical protein
MRFIMSPPKLYQPPVQSVAETLMYHDEISRRHVFAGRPRWALRLRVDAGTPPPEHNSLAAPRQSMGTS